MVQWERECVVFHCLAPGQEYCSHSFQVIETGFGEQETEQPMDWGWAGSAGVTGAPDSWCYPLGFDSLNLGWVPGVRIFKMLPSTGKSCGTTKIQSFMTEVLGNLRSCINSKSEPLFVSCPESLLLPLYAQEMEPPSTQLLLQRTQESVLYFPSH